MNERDRSISLQMLEVFAAFAETLNFTQTAKRLGISQSAVSQSLARLEKNLGEPLMTHEVRPVRLTVAGHRLLSLSATLLEEKARLIQAIGQGKSDVTHHIRVAVSEIASEAFSDVIDAYLIDHFKNVTVLSDFIPQTQTVFKNKEVDLAVVPDLNANETAYCLAAYAENYLIVTPRRGVFEKEGLSLSFLREHLGERFISYPVASSDRRRSQAILRMLSMNAAVHFELESSRAVAHAVASGEGWSILAPTTLFLLGEAIENVTVHPLGKRAEKKVLYVATHEKAYQADVEALVSRIQTKVKEELLPWFSKRSYLANAAIHL